MKLVEWDSLKMINGNDGQKEIAGQVAAVIVSENARYYIQIVGDCIQIHKTGFQSDQICALPHSSNVLLIK